MNYEIHVLRDERLLGVYAYVTAYTQQTAEKLLTDARAEHPEWQGQLALWSNDDNRYILRA